MKKIAFIPLFAFVLSLLSVPMAHSQEKLKKPNGEQLMYYATIINSNPATDRTKTNQTLEKWIAGELEVPKMSKATDEKGTGERAACIAACCGFLGCNPICVAGCSML